MATAGTDGADRAGELSVVTLAYAVLTFLMALPFSLAPGSRILGDVPDAHLYLWTLAWDAHAFLSQPLRLFDANIYYPYANTLGYSENLIGSAFIAAPVLWLTGNIVLATNLTALATCMLCGVGAYILARRLQIGVGGAFLCGLIFAFAPPRFIRMGQLHMTAMQWIPFSLAFLHTYLDRGTRRDLWLALACFSMQALSSGHGAVYLVVAITALLAWRFALGDPLDLRRRFRDFGVAGAYLIAPAVWVFMPYRIAQADTGLLGGYLDGALPNVESFVASPSRFHQFLQETFWGPFAKEPDAFLFPGVMAMVLAATAVVSRAFRRGHLRQNYVAFYLCLGILSTMMFLSWPVEIWRHVYWLPGLSFIRMPSRFVVLTVLTLAVLAGFGVDRLARRLSKKAAAVATVTIAVFLLAEYSAHPFAGVPFAINIPAIDRWLDTRPKPFVIAEVPSPHPRNLGALERHQTRSMFHATAHWQKTIHGYSGLRQPLHDRLYLDLAGFPDAVSLASLRDVGVTHVVVHTDDYGGSWRTVEEQIARTPALKLEHVEGAGRVYTILPE